MSRILRLSGHTKFVEDCSYSVDGSRLISCGGDQSILLWDVEKNQKQKIGKHNAEVWSCDFSKYGIYVCSGSSDRTVRIWDQRSQGEIAIFRGHTNTVWSCAFDPSWSSWRLASGSSDMTVKIWNWKTLSVEETLEKHRNTVEHVTFSENGGTVMSCSRDRTVHIHENYKNMSERNLRILKGHQGRINYCDFLYSSEDKIVSCADDKTVRIWDTLPDVKAKIIRGHGNTVWCCDSRPLNDTVVVVSCSSDRSIRFWDISDGTELKRIRKMDDEPEDQLLCCRFSPDLSQLAVCSNDGNIYLIQMKDILDELLHRI